MVKVWDGKRVPLGWVQSIEQNVLLRPHLCVGLSVIVVRVPVVVFTKKMIRPAVYR